MTSLTVPPIKEVQLQEIKVEKKEMVPPGRQLITRRWVIYSIVITCIGISIALIVIAGLLFSQNQNYIPQQPSNPPISSQITAPLDKIAPGFLLMSPQYMYTFSFTGNLNFYPTTSLGGTIIWSSLSNSNSFNSTLNFSSGGILYIQDTNGVILWQSTENPGPTNTDYILQVLDSGEVRIRNGTGQEIWSIQTGTPTLTASPNMILANRILPNNFMLQNGIYTFQFTLNNYPQLIITEKYNSSSSTVSSLLLWSSTPFLKREENEKEEMGYASITLYGNLLLIDKNFNQIWSSQTATLIFSEQQQYRMNLLSNGVLQLQMLNKKKNEFQTYFQTTNDQSNRTIRLPNLPWSQSSLTIFKQQTQPQTIIQSSDESTQFIYESNGSLSLYVLVPNRQILSNTGNIRGSTLILHGSEVVHTNPNLMGCLALYATDEPNIPKWTFQPSIPITSPSLQLPTTLCFSDQNRLTLISQTQEILLSKNTLI